MKKKKNICAVILSGGLSSRMGGGIKSLKVFNNKTVFERILHRIEKQVNYIIVNSNENNKYFDQFNLSIVKDSFQGHMGPLAGIHAGMKWVQSNIPKTEWILTVPSDTPFIPDNLVEKLCRKTKKNNNKIILAKSYKKIHPVIGLWKSDLLDNLEKNLNEGIRKIMLWVSQHPYDTQSFRESYFDPFFNINYKADLDLAKKIEDKYL